MQVTYKKDRENYTPENIMNSMMDYIHANYRNADMSLAFMAEHFGLTASYIGKLFKKNKQVNFKYYLTEYRIKKAVEILDKQKNIKIMALAKIVGYDHVNSFNRNFKRIMKTTPCEHKRKMILQNSNLCNQADDFDVSAQNCMQ